jgi:hypothetical protein
MDRDSLLAHMRERPSEWFCVIAHPSGRGQMFIGSAAYKRLEALAERYLNAEADRRAKASSEAFFVPFRDEFVRWFLKELREPSESSVEQMLGAAYKRLEQSFDARTYYVPCAIVVEDDPAEFQIGPVTFVRTSRFWELHSNEIEGERLRLRDEIASRWSSCSGHAQEVSDRAEKEALEFANHLVGGLREYFSPYHWVAYVNIPAAEIKTSEQLAERTVQAALDLLKLVFGSGHSDRIRTGSSPSPPLQMARLFRDSAGRFNIALGRSWPGNAVGKDWYSIISGPAALYLQTGGQLICKLKEFSTPIGLSARFLDALRWFGDAVAEPNPAAQLTKYVFAIERVTLTKRDRRISDAVCNRAAVFWADQGGPLFEWTERVRSVYKARSDVAHGRLSPFDGGIPALAAEASRIARMTLLGALQIIHATGRPDLADKELRQVYADLQARHFLNGWPWRAAVVWPTKDRRA